MKTRSILILLVTALLIQPVSVFAQTSPAPAQTTKPTVKPFTIVFIADQKSKGEAQEMRNWLKSMAPYNAIASRDLAMKLVTVPRKQDTNIPKKNPTGCRNIVIDGYNYPSKCREDYLLKVSAEMGGDVTVVFPSGLQRGYASGTKKLAFIDMDDNTKDTLVHELGHVIGDFDDEYNYEGPVSRYKCAYPYDNHSPNVSSIVPRVSYTGRTQAMKVHANPAPVDFESIKQTAVADVKGSDVSRFIQVRSGRVYTVNPRTSDLKNKTQMQKSFLYTDAQAKKDTPLYIPWMNAIPKNNTILHREGKTWKLGTQKEGDEIGIYRGGSCNSVYPTFRAYHRTVMGKAGTTFLPPYYRNVMVEQMGKIRGVPISSYKQAKVK